MKVVLQYSLNLRVFYKPVINNMAHSAGEATQNFLKMFYAYVIKSVNHDFFYKGHCENIEERLL